MTIFCGQTNIPTLDETPLPCDVFTSTDCLIYTKPIPYFGFLESSSGTEVLDAILASLIEARGRIAQLEAIIATMPV